MTKTLTHSITCGACKGSHETPADVKACYAAKVERQAPSHTTYPDPTKTPGLSWNNRPQPTQPEPPQVYDGIYTVETDDRHYTFKVRTQASDAKFAPGAVVVSYLRGRDNDEDYTAFAFLRPGNVLVTFKKFRTGSCDAMIAAAEMFIAHPEQALEAAHCRRCGRTLTVPASVHNGLGPECAKKGLR